MIHPVFMTVLRRPDLAASHVANYVELFKSELSTLGTSLVVRAVSAALAVVALVLALGLTGVAFMLGYIHGFHRVLVVVPAVAWAVAAIAAVLAMRSNFKERVNEVKEEFDADLELLRMVKEANNG